MDIHVSNTVRKTLSLDEEEVEKIVVDWAFSKGFLATEVVWKANGIDLVETYEEGGIERLANDKN